MAERKQLVRAVAGYSRSVAMEDGKVIRHEHQELGPTIRRVQYLDQINQADGGGKMGRRYIGSVDKTILIDWLRSRGYTMDQWARNEGGTRCPAGADPVAHATLDGGVRSEFLRYYLSRDFSKLHTQHTTTRREMSSFVVPLELRGNDDKLRTAQDGGSVVAEPGRPHSENPGLHQSGGS